MMMMIIPSQIQIETVAGLCNLRCIMCTVEQSLRKGIMHNDTYQNILERFLPYKKHIEHVSLLGLGETLIDKDVAKKIQLTKTLDGGYKGVGIYTNGMLLTTKLSLELLEAKLDTLIVSMDGITKNTQEKIRIGSDVNMIIYNIMQFIQLRNSSKEYSTKIIIRFTEQDINKYQWRDFYIYWKKRLDFNKGDLILNYPVHNVGNMKKSFTPSRYDIAGIKCKEVYDRIIIFLDGKIGLCCGDQFNKYENGNIFESDPIELYNKGHFTHFRNEMDKGNILGLELCSKCSVAYSILMKKEVR
ncbi:MAG: radical SAM protein [Candidatus Cloacimonadota bacterium]|nr:radical SAM protein [Candidatus Cloacimonadota bacterium]